MIIYNLGKFLVLTWWRIIIRSFCYRILI